MDNHLNSDINNTPTAVTNVVHDLIQHVEKDTDLKKVNSVSQGNAKNTIASSGNRFTDPICSQQNLFSAIPASKVVEYQWPSDSSGEYYMLQEQVTAFLNIKSFKRKYPEIRRRKLDPTEINYLLNNQFITEVQVTLGLTALRSQDVCDMMAKEYPEKYKEYLEVMQEREKQRRRSKYKQITATSSSNVEKTHVPLLMKRAMKQAASYNAHLNRQRREEFAYYYDMHTQVLQYPANKVRKLHPSLTKPSLYPCALIPGQFQEYHKKYSRDELMFFPVQTALYGPPQPCPKGDTLFSESDSETESIISVATTSTNTTSSLIKKPQSLHGIVIKPSSLSNAANFKSENGIKIENDFNNPDVNMDTAAAAEVHKEKPVCGICHKDETCNKSGNHEDMIKCTQCDNHGHPSCLEMTDNLVKVLQTYNWQCMECKTCTICSHPHREDLLMFCDRCDRGYHTYCVSLRAIPSGVWACSRCIHEDPDFKKRRRKEIRLLSNSSPKLNQHHKLKEETDNHSEHNNNVTTASDSSTPKTALNSNHTGGNEDTAVNNLSAKRKILNNKLNHVDGVIRQNGTSLPNKTSAISHKGNDIMTNHHGIAHSKLNKISRKTIDISMTKKEQIKTS